MRSVSGFAVFRSEGVVKPQIPECIINRSKKGKRPSGGKHDGQAVRHGVEKRMASFKKLSEVSLLIIGPDFEWVVIKRIAEQSICRLSLSLLS